MFVTSAFSGDNNAKIMNAQHHMYDYLVFEIFQSAKNTFLLSDAICEKLTAEERQNLQEQTSFDHRTLQKTHDFIAAAFRYNHSDGAISLFEPSQEEIEKHFSCSYNKWTSEGLSEIEIIWALKWEEFYLKHIEILTSIQTKFPKFVYGVMNASALNSNNISGRSSEVTLMLMLTQYFDVPFKAPY